MKILNSTYRDAYQGEDVLKTPVSGLDNTTELARKSLIHIIHCETTASGDKYESKNMTIECFENKVYEAIQNTFKVDYEDTHGGVADDRYGHSIVGADTLESEEKASGKKSSWKDMVAYLKERHLDPTEPEYVQGNYKKDSFVTHVNYDFEVLKRYVVVRDDELDEDITQIKKELVRYDYPFDTEMVITTTDRNNDVTHESVTHVKTENSTHCQMTIKVGNKISNEWTTPASGMLVVYGWVDSSDALNNKAIPSAFCVLEGKIVGINPTSTTEDSNEQETNTNDEETSPSTTDDATTSSGNWEILAAQPVIPAKSITYVGFTVPVHKSLTLRVRTGFTVGAKSGQYSNENDGWDSLSNSTPNGFKCQIFSNKQYKDNS